MARQAEQRLMELPDALWSKVLSCLSLEDLLNARLVCKGFVQLSQLPELHLDWSARCPKASSSFMLFASRHLMPPSSPPLSIILASSPIGECFLQLQISLACQCNSLRKLEIWEGLDLTALQSLLQMLPTGLASLKLFPSGDLVRIIEEPAWSRLAALTDLRLWLPRGTPQTRVQGSLLAHLPSLQSLTLNFDELMAGDKEAGITNTCVFEAGSFVHQGITLLEIGNDPIKGHLDLTQLPSLRTIYLSECCTLPAWLRGKQFETLQIEMSRQLNGIDLRQLLCRRLEIHSHPQVSKPWQLSALLRLPRLSEIHVHFEHMKHFVQENEHVKLVGSSMNHKDLLRRIRACFAVPVVLSITGCTGIGSAVRLRSNGHAVACVCPEC